jgi:radical SAM protein with 4Fe4S-binding SPASM domain
MRPEPARVRFLQVEPTTRCNFTCGFCAGRHMDQTDLDLDAFTSALDRLPDVEHVELQGEGEPLLHPAFFAMARRARMRGIEVSTITNGSMFSRERIEKLLDADLTSVLVSIESPQPGEFASLRGGRLDKVIDGVGAFVAARNGRGLARPAVGLAVTVLKSTEARFPDILALYRRLGLDGGLVVQTLNGMEVYTRGYSEALRAETYAGLGRALVERRLLRRAARAGIARRGEPTLFWTALYAGAERPEAGCPWLRHGLYIDRRGRVTTCPHVKDADRHALGRLDEDGLDAILSARRHTQRALESGDVPTPCRGCAIADAIARRVAGREASA